MAMAAVTCAHMPGSLASVSARRKEIPGQQKEPLGTRIAFFCPGEFLLRAGDLLGCIQGLSAAQVLSAAN